MQFLGKLGVVTISKAVGWYWKVVIVGFLLITYICAPIKFSASAALVSLLQFIVIFFVIVVKEFLMMDITGIFRF